MTKHNDAPLERERVYSRISPLILTFYRDNAGRRFHAEDLLKYVRRYYPEIAPDSPGRILRELRKEKRLFYVVLNRHESLYQFAPRVMFKLVTSR